MKKNYPSINEYLEGKESLEDKRIIAEWFDNLQAEKELRSRSMQYWDKMENNPDTGDYNEGLALGQIYRKIKLDEIKNKSGTSSVLRILRIVTRIAAVLFIPLLVMYITNLNHIDFKDSKIAYTEIYSPPGSRTKFYLPDGSNGWLNGGSYLKYPQIFLGKTRNVTLRGEAYFEVVTNPDRPFIVTGKRLDIIAKGTAFNVSAWDDESGAKIVLVHGKLEIYRKTNDHSKLIAKLLPNQLLNYLPKGSESFIQRVDVGKYISWTQGKLVFDDDPFNDVVQQINRWYNVNIIIKDDILRSYTYVATFQDESLDEVLKMLKLSAPIEYKNVKRKQHIDGTFDKRTILLYYKPKK